MHTIALIGGTGPEGRGLALRFALAGHRVVIGSRQAERGAEAASGLRAALAGAAGSTGDLTGTSNELALAEADIAVVVVPYEAHRATLEGLRDRLAWKIVVDAVVPVRFERGPRPVEVEAGSATEEAAQILPDSRVIGAFHNLAAEVLLDPGASVDADVLVTGNDAEAKETVLILAGQIKGTRAVDAGPLRFSRFVEGLTLLLIGINGRYKAHSSIRVSGLPLEGVR
ncbi:MAG: NADPH-dependent F420 reductase [Dehalococcoidia bacterium]|nr:NADPH-dependent F420 reductase [Dehalococcoidia bacterium]